MLRSSTTSSLATSTPRLLSAALIACALAGTTGCDSRPSTDSTPTRSAGGKTTVMTPNVSAPAASIAAAQQNPAPVASLPPRRGAIATITTTDDRILVEMTLDENVRAHALEPGMFFRVHTKNGAAFKGLTQITEVVSPTRAIARQVGITDRSQPLVTGDQVEEVADLAALAPPDAVETAVRDQQLKLDQLDTADRRLFDAVRANYQQALSEAEQRFKTTLSQSELAHREQLEAAEQAHRLADDRRISETKANEIATRATLAASVTKAISDERKANTERVSALSAERDRLRNQVDSLLTQQQTAAARIEELLRIQAEKDRSAQIQIRSEVETREVLQARLDEVESKLTGRSSPTVTVLTADPTHPETVLERLARVTRELAIERDTRQRLEINLAAMEKDLATLRAERDRVAQQASTLAHADERATKAEAALVDASKRVASAEQTRDLLELARLEAERRLFDLSARVLRLSDAAPATVALQARLRDSLAAQSMGKTP